MLSNSVPSVPSKEAKQKLYSKALSHVYLSQIIHGVLGFGQMGISFWEVPVYSKNEQLQNPTKKFTIPSLALKEDDFDTNDKETSITFEIQDYFRPYKVVLKETSDMHF